jgi:polyhydroxybutyrate depolymerase
MTARAWLGVALAGVIAAAAALAAFAHAHGDSRPAATRAATPPCLPPAAGNHMITVQDGRAPVLLHVPKRLPKGRPPLVLVLPGAGQTGSVMAHYTGYDALADRKGFLVAYPTASGTRPFWNVSGTVAGKPDDLAYLRTVITTLTGDAGCANPLRVGVTGVSNGGGMAARLACDAADLLAAAAPVAGGYSTLPDCRPQRTLPVLEVHGLKDTVVPYHGKGPDHAGDVDAYVQGWRTRDGCGPKVTRSRPAKDVQELRWTCAQGRVVVQDRVVDAEHGWPGEDSLRPFSSTLRTWQFLSAFVNDRR